MAFFNKDIQSTFKILNSGELGINSSSIEERRQKYGKNELKKGKKSGFFKKLLAQFKNIMIIILLISAIISEVSAVTQKNYENLFEGLLIFFIVLINAIVGVIQEQKAEDALAALQQSTEPLAKVIRDGKVQRVKVHEIVVGDVVLLRSGDYVPADIRLFECNGLMTNESSLTGESNPVAKTTQTIQKKDALISEQENMCFSGTTVSSGSAKGVVVAVGMNAEFGKIAKVLTSSTKEKTPLEKNIDRIGKVITLLVVGIVILVFFVQVLLGKNTSVLNALLTAVALAVAAIPESLPAVITIIMALGVQKLAKHNAIVKKLSAVETLGCCNVICSDKTGTLTKNQMVASHIFNGKTLVPSQNVKMETIQNLILVGALCNNALIDTSNKLSADATETAIVNFLRTMDVNIIKLKDTHNKLAENEFNSNRKLMSVTCRDGEGYVLCVKGALDYILEKCKYIFVNGKIEPLTENYLKQVSDANKIVCEKGERVIAFALRRSTEKVIEECDLTFVGFLSLIDPPRPETKESIKLCKKAGLKTIMITGDHPITALSIATELGIAKSKKQVLTGKELNDMSERELSKIIENYTVFARVTPEHKLKIVKALKAKGYVVAMTGDGVNDAPSVKTANIGACMGITGTDVTKEVADIIITDDNFATLVLAVKEGRTIYQNITKTILFLLSTNIVEVLGIFITSLVMPSAIFLLPTQILFINLVTDSLPAFALGIEPSEKNIMDRPPRDPNKSLLSGKIGSSIIYQGFVQSLMVLVMFVCANNFYGGAVASTMSFMTICLMQIIHAINCKTEGSIFKINILKNKFFNYSFLALFALIMLVYFVPPLAALFSLTKLNIIQWVWVWVCSLSIIPLVEFGKLFIKS